MWRSCTDEERMRRNRVVSSKGCGGGDCGGDDCGGDEHLLEGGGKQEGWRYIIKLIHMETNPKDKVDKSR